MSTAVPERAEVLVVGGGPAGAAAAIAFARAGREVTIVDKATFPRDKCCGDGLTTGALRHLEALGLDPASVPSWHVVDDVVVRSPSGRVVRFPLPRGRGAYAAVARRAELDAAVLDLARAAGAVVCEGVSVTGAVSETHEVIVETAGGTIRAAQVIAADGAWSAIRKALAPDPPGYLGEWHAFRQYVTHTGPTARDLWVLFEPDLLPGYAWSFPLGGDTANVGYGILRRPGQPTKAMAAQWRDLLARPTMRAVLGDEFEPESTHKAWPIPARIGEAPLAAAGGRVLFIGDAARATDPMTGEGIGQAFDTAAMAADAVLSHPSDPVGAAATYQRAVDQSLTIDHRLAQWLSSALSHRKGARAAVRIAGATDWTRRNFARWLFEDYPRAIVATPSRWRASRHAPAPFS